MLHIISVLQVLQELGLSQNPSKYEWGVAN